MERSEKSDTSVNIRGERESKKKNCLKYKERLEKSNMRIKYCEDREQSTVFEEREEDARDLENGLHVQVHHAPPSCIRKLFCRIDQSRITHTVQERKERRRYGDSVGQRMQRERERESYGEIRPMYSRRCSRVCALSFLARPQMRRLYPQRLSHEKREGERQGYVILYAVCFL